MTLIRMSERVHRFADVSNAYVITHGASALLIDSGAGGVLDVLPSLGVERVDWVLHTHHHRDQCLGDPALIECGAQIAAPAREAQLLADAEGYWQSYDPYDRYDGASSDNCPTSDVPVSRRLSDHDTFSWHDLSLTVVPTPGHTRGSVTYLVEVDGISYAFSGDLISAPGTVWSLHDLEWWYGLGEGARVAAHSARMLRLARPDVLAPSHGEPISDPGTALRALERNLGRYVATADRGYKTRLGPDPLEPEGRFVRVTDHLIAVVNTCAHFYVLLSETGESLFFDYGMASEHHGMAGFRFTEHSLAELRERFGVPPPSVVIATHYHDDHVCGVPFLQRRHGTRVWASSVFADILERPSSYKLPCIAETPIQVERKLPVGPVEWNEYRFDVRHNPGHTWYASSILFTVDGVRVAAVGDEIGIDPDGLFWGNVPVWRNRVAPADYVTSVDDLVRFDPRVVLTGHKGPLDVSPARLRALRTWALDLDAACRALTDERNAGFAWDPGFASAYPYQLGPDGGDVRVDVRNHLPEQATATIRPVPPAGWRIEPESQSIAIASGDSGCARFRVTPPARRRAARRDAIPIDVALDDRRLGQPTELLVSVG